MKNKPVNPPEQIITRMENLWREYDRTQMRTGWDLEKEHPEVVPRDKLDDIWAWEDYAVGEYVKWLGEPFEAQPILEAVVVSHPGRADWND